MDDLNKSFFVARTCTEIISKQRITNSLSKYRDCPAYVLLGDLGAGKTEAFKREAAESDGKYIVARDFILFEADHQKHYGPYFIDGLDEMRSGNGDGKTPLDQVRKQIEKLGRPKFRLSCREADWLGASDAKALARVTPNEKIAVLHLDPLTDSDVINILKHKPQSLNVERFIANAQSNGLDELLRNPQTLNLLLQAAGESEWPQSRKGVYESACMHLVRELNPEHQSTNSSVTRSSDVILDAAGYLCAIQLLAGVAGYSLCDAALDNEYIGLKELVNPNALPLVPALRTNLFQGEGENRLKPIHRSVAEYLGARFIAKIINEHDLSVGRVLALMTGEDGGVVADLRGLAAWISVHCQNERQLFIERDPLGVVLYGDVKSFSSEDKYGILKAMHTEALRFPWFRSDDWSIKPFGALGTKDMESYFRSILASDSRKDADQALLDCVLDAIRFGDPLLDLQNSIFSIIRDSSYWPSNRLIALMALLRVTNIEDPILVSLAEDVRVGAIEDYDNELLGAILNNFYPSIISPERVFNFFHLQKWKNSINSYFMFWIHELPDKSNSDEIVILLDQFHLRKNEFAPFMRDQQLSRLAGELLVRGLKEMGDAFPSGKIYDWLGIGLDDFLPQLEKEHVKEIQNWLQNRANRYKEIIVIGIQQCSDQLNVGLAEFHCLARLYGATAPEGIENWYLSKAAEELQDQIAKIYFHMAFTSLRDKNNQTYLSQGNLEFLSEWVDKHPRFRSFFESYLIPSPDFQHNYAIEVRQRQSERDRVAQENKSAWLKYLRDNIVDIREGNSPLNIYYDLARAYRGNLIDALGETSRDRINTFLDSDTALVSAVMSGFRHVVFRKDLPTFAGIFALQSKGQIHFLCWPCLIGMDELFEEDPEKIVELDNKILSSMIAFCFVDHVEKDPIWFLKLIRGKPDLVAEILVAYTLHQIKGKKDFINTIYSLAQDDGYADVARLALPKLLENFPLRPPKNQLTNSLGQILRTALRYLEQQELLSTIERKLKLKSIASAQKVLWMACGLLLNPQKYGYAMRNYIGNSQTRRIELAKFLQTRGEDQLSRIKNLPENTLALLLEILGPSCQAERVTGIHWISPVMETSGLLHSIIRGMTESASDIAVAEFERLLDLPSLVNWHNPIRAALHSIRIARRKATFHRLSSREVSITLANQSPTSSSDLAALVFDHLRDLANKIRNGNSNDVKQYWSYDAENKKLTTPKPENDCRDILLSQLNAYLRFHGIEIAKEGSYADNKRADLKVSFGGADGFNVPIEVKKDNHRDLWKAIETQLIEKYVRDPGSEGHGIYLVFWFGQNKVTPSPSGKKPRSAKELEEWLVSLLSLDKKYSIKICVIDCSLHGKNSR